MPVLPPTFAALGDDTRFALVERLLTEGELSAGDLSDDARISAPAISRHLKILREAGVITQRVDKQKRMYSVRPEAIQAINGWTILHKEFWESALARLEKLLKKEEKKNE